MRKKLLVVLAAVAALSLAAPAAAAEARWWFPKPATAEITLVHGIPGDGGFPVDISLYGIFTRTSQQFDDVTFGTVAGPLEVRQDIYLVKIRPSGSKQVALFGVVFATRGSDRAVVAHLSESGSPRLSVYDNNAGPKPGAGEGKVIVRHAAAAPAVDVIADVAATPEDENLKVISDLRNPRQAVVNVPATDFIVKVAAAADNSIVAFEGPLSVAEGKTTVVYAVGDLAGGSFTPLVQVLG